MGDATPITLRRAEAADEAILFEIYASTREKELNLVDWGAAERQAFLRMQFDAQRTHYRQEYPDSQHDIILLNGRPIGRIWVERNQREICILDIALLPADRGAGVGTYLFREAIREAEETRRPLRHSVERNNPDALRFYERLGFVVVSEIPTHFFMEHRATAAAGPSD